jgi:hypothetical protein
MVVCRNRPDLRYHFDLLETSIESSKIWAGPFHLLFDFVEKRADNRMIEAIEAAIICRGRAFDPNAINDLASGLHGLLESAVFAPDRSLEELYG